MSESTSLTSASDRLEHYDATLTSIDLRGRGTPGSSDARVPRSKIRRFIAALKNHGQPPPSLQMTQCCQLKYLYLHNNFLDPCELPLLFDVLPCLPSLETFLLFNHDVGDEGVELLMHTLTTGNKKHNHESDLTGDNAEKEVLAVSKTLHKSWGLKELYLSHCNIGCKGASSIAKALDCASSSISRSKLKYLQVLSLGSNRIEEEGAQLLAEAFGRYPSLQRMVLHGNKGLASTSPSFVSDSKVDGSSESLFHHALIPAGWRGPADSDSVQTAPTEVAMSVLAPLIQLHIQRRWGKESVLIRPHDLLRQQLQHVMNKNGSTFVDSHLEVMPDILSWIGRNGACCRQTSLHSKSLRLKGKVKFHSSGREKCQACATIHLNDLYELFARMPHLLTLFRGISTACTRSKKCEGLFC